LLIGESGGELTRSIAALVAVVVGLLAGIGPSAYAQSNYAPTAVIVELGQPDADGNVALNGSLSFDIDDGDVGETCGGCSHQWEVVTPSYYYLANLLDDGDPTTADDARVAVTSFRPPEPHLVELYGPEIEFRLTVTDAQGAIGVATMVYRAIVNREPTAAITVTAKQFNRAHIQGHDDNGNGKVDENEERYSLEGVIHAPGVAENDDNEWDIRERSLLVVDGSGSFDPDGPLPASAFRWEVLYHSDVPSVTSTLPVISVGQISLSTDENPAVVGTTTSETIGRLPSVRGGGALPYYLYYVLTVTDEHGASDTAVVKIVIRDAHDNPTVEIGHPESDPETSTNVDRRAGIQPAGPNRYIVFPEVAEEGVILTATGEGDGAVRTRELVHTWSGPHLEPSEFNQAGAETTALFTASEGTEEGDSFIIDVEVVDSDGHRGSTKVELVVAENTPPSVTVPDDIDTPDGNNGGFPVADPPTGMVRLVGFGFDLDGDPLTFQWEQVRNALGDPLRVTDRAPRLALSRSDTQIASFRLPEVTRGSQNTVYMQFTATDRWGVSDSDIVTIIIRDGDDDLRAIAGVDRKAKPGEAVLLRGNFDSGLVSEDAIAAVNYTWAYIGIETHPQLAERKPLTDAEIAEGFAPGEWFPNADDAFEADAGGRVMNAGTQFGAVIGPVTAAMTQFMIITPTTAAVPPTPASEPTDSPE